MRWNDREESENVEDRRGMTGPAAATIGAGGLLLAVVLYFLGVDPRDIQRFLFNANQQQQQQAGPNAPGDPNRPVDPEQEKQAKFTKVIFHDTEVIWGDIFAQARKTYEKPTLVLYSGMVDSACGQAEAAVGPFYCPGDSKVYIDLAFYADMQRKLQAPGEFARAYVVAHEVGHHVQRLLGYTKLMDQSRQTGSKAEIKQMSVRLELQADYLAGVWANQGQKKFQFLDDGDIDSALNAAFQIGDDRLQKQSQGYVVPDAFTHGTSKQRMRWFTQGYKTGDVPAAGKAFELEYDQL